MNKQPSTWVDNTPVLCGRLGGRGAHLFTLEVAGELQASKLALEPDGPERPRGLRLAVGMQLVLPALKVRWSPECSSELHHLHLASARSHSEYAAVFAPVACCIVCPSVLLTTHVLLIDRL